MKNALLMMLSLLLVTACGNNGQKTAQNADTTTTDPNTVYVYYFHGKQRCMTCNAVEEVAKKVIENNYASNSNVKFLVIPNYEKENEALLEKYEISWNALVVDKNGDVVDITEEAFSNAVNNPDILTELIKTEVSKRSQ